MPDARAEWFTVFRVWLAARLRFEFIDADWSFQVHETYGRVTAMPSGSASASISWNLPTDFRGRPPYVIAAQVAADIRVQAEEMGLVSRRRTTQPPPPPARMAALIDPPSEELPAPSPHLRQM